MPVFLFKQTSKQKKGDSHDNVRSEVGKTNQGFENNSHIEGSHGNEINVRTFVTQTHNANTSVNLENEREQGNNSERYMEIIRDPTGVKLMFLKLYSFKHFLLIT